MTQSDTFRLDPQMNDSREIGAPRPSPQAQPHPVKPISGPRIVCVGDSLTKGRGIAPGENNYPKELKAMTGHAVVNLGIGGETSQTIEGRLGSDPFLAMPEGGEIPASGAVPVALTSHDGRPVAPLVQGGQDHINPCRIADIRGTLALSSGQYVFQRAARGAATAITRPIPLLPSASNRYRGDIIIKWTGQNDGPVEAQRLIDGMQKTIDWMQASEKRWLICGLTTNSLAYRATLHDALNAAFGARFVDLQKFLVSRKTLDDFQIAPSARDISELKAGLVPGCLRADGVHLNGKGYKLVAHCIAARLSELDWLSPA